MLDLINAFSIKEIFIFLVMLALAGKSFIDFINWCKEQYKKQFDKDYKVISKEEKFDELVERQEKQNKEIKELYGELKNQIDILAQESKDIKDTVTILKVSDMRDIKGWIVEKHHQLMRQGWVDDFTMDTLEKRYSSYMAEDGNTYVGDLMTDLRNLPKFDCQK